MPLGGRWLYFIFLSGSAKTGCSGSNPVGVHLSLYFFNLRDTYRHIIHCSCRIPKLGGNDLDLHLLYKEVTSRGGLEQVFLLVDPIFAGYPHISLVILGLIYSI
jgi:hypothetical protein